MMQDLNVVVDIGSTNTRVGLCDGSNLIDDSIRRYRNIEHSGIEPILRDYLAHYPTRPNAIWLGSNSRNATLMKRKLDPHASAAIKNGVIQVPTLTSEGAGALT